MPRKFFVSETCISCGACWRLSEDHFESHPVHANAVVKLQPRNSLEFESCLNAMDICPVGAIGYRIVELTQVDEALESGDDHEIGKRAANWNRERAG